MANELSVELFRQTEYLPWIVELVETEIKKPYLPKGFNLLTYLVEHPNMGRVKLNCVICRRARLFDLSNSQVKQLRDTKRESEKHGQRLSLITETEAMNSFSLNLRFLGRNKHYNGTMEALKQNILDNLSFGPMSHEQLLNLTPGHCQANLIKLINDMCLNRELGIDLSRKLSKDALVFLRCEKPLIGEAVSIAMDQIKASNLFRRKSITEIYNHAMNCTQIIDASHQHTLANFINEQFENSRLFRLIPRAQLLNLDIGRNEALKNSGMQHPVASSKQRHLWCIGELRPKARIAS